MKFRTAAIILIAALLSGLIWMLIPDDAAFEYFSVHCNIFRRDGQLIYSRPGKSELCAFHSDGSVLTSLPLLKTLELYDKDDQLVWSLPVAAHHDLKFTPDEKRILLITSENIEFRGERVRSDCFSVRDLKGKIIHEWCLKDHVDELIERGFVFQPQKIWEQNKILEPNFPDYEIAHSNTIYEIEPNAASGNPAFAPGNILVHIYKPSYALIILDPTLTKILWLMDFSKFRFHGMSALLNTHDNQMTPDGTMLSFVNRLAYNELPRDPLSQMFQPNLGMFCCLTYVNKHDRSRLIEFNPLTQEILWEYQPKDKTTFQAEIYGSINKLINGNFLFTNITNSSLVQEVDPSGEEVWRFLFPTPSNAVGKTMPLRSVRPFSKISFLKARNLIDD